MLWSFVLVHFIQGCLRGLSKQTQMTEGYTLRPLLRPQKYGVWLHCCCGECISSRIEGGNVSINATINATPHLKIRCSQMMLIFLFPDSMKRHFYGIHIPVLIAERGLGICDVELDQISVGKFSPTVQLSNKLN